MAEGNGEQLSNGKLSAPEIKAVRIDITGQPVVILHGWGQNLSALRPLGELLGKYRQVHLLDLPGFGASPKPKEDWDTLQYAQCVLRYMDENKLDKADLLGHSFGGHIALRLAAHYPDRVKSLVLIDSSGLKRPPSTQRIMIRNLGQVLKVLDKIIGTSLFKNCFAPRFASRDYKNAGEMKNILVKSVNHDVTQEAQQIKNPCLILWGDKDQETPVELAERLHELIANSKIVVLPGKDHFPFASVGAHLCAFHILKFWQTLAGDGQ